MAEDKEADSPDESTPAARPERDDTEAVSDETSEEVVEEHVAPEDAREPTVEELEQLLESDDSEDADDSDDADRSSVTDSDGDDDSDDSDDDSDPDGELVAVGASTKSGKAAAAKGEDSSVAKTTGKARSKKEKATPKQKKAVEKPKRTTPVSFVREAVGELRKVVYPTAPQLGNYFIVVLVFVLIIIGFVSLLDLGFGWVIVKVFS